MSKPEPTSVGDIILAMDTGNISLAKHLLIKRMTEAPAPSEVEPDGDTKAVWKRKAMEAEAESSRLRLCLSVSDEARIKTLEENDRLREELARLLQVPGDKLMALLDAKDADFAGQRRRADELMLRAERAEAELAALKDKACPSCGCDGRGRWPDESDAATIAALREKAAPDEKVREARYRNAIIEVLSDLEGGFVRCQNCGDQEDTATLDCVRILRAALKAKPLDAEIEKAKASMLADPQSVLSREAHEKAEKWLVERDMKAKPAPPLPDAGTREAVKNLEILMLCATPDVRGRKPEPYGYTDWDGWVGSVRNQLATLAPRQEDKP